MNRQFTVSPELQQYLQGVGSRALTNVTWNLSFTGHETLLPSSSVAIRRSLVFDKSSLGDEATPVARYNVFISNLDGSSEVQISSRRGI